MRSRLKPNLRTQCMVVTTCTAVMALGLQLEYRFLRGVEQCVEQWLLPKPPIISSEPFEPPPSVAPEQIQAVIPECDVSLQRVLEAIKNRSDREDPYLPVHLYVHGSDAQTVLCTLTPLTDPNAHGNFVDFLSRSGFRSEWNFDRTLLILQEKHQEAECLLLCSGSADAEVVHAPNPYRFNVWRQEFLRGRNPLLGEAKIHVDKVHFQVSDLLSPTGQAQILIGAFGGDVTWTVSQKEAAQFIRVDLRISRPLRSLSAKGNALAQR